MSNHLSPDELADLQEDLLEPSAAASAAGHLRTCERCRIQAADLGAVRAELRGAADVGPIPPEVVERLDAALATAGQSSYDVTPLMRARPRRWWVNTRVLQAAAAVVLVVAGAGIVAPVLTTTGGVDSPADRTSAKAGAGGEAREQGRADSGGVRTLASGTDYTQETLPRAVTRLLAAPKAAASAPAPPGDETTSQGETTKTPEVPLAGRSGLAECVAGVAPPPATPVLVDEARFNGRPATLIVVELPEEPERLAAWVVGPGCARGDGEVLHFAWIPRR